MKTSKDYGVDIQSWKEMDDQDLQNELREEKSRELADLELLKDAIEKCLLMIRVSEIEWMGNNPSFNFYIKKSNKLLGTIQPLGNEYYQIYTFKNGGHVSDDFDEALDYISWVFSSEINECESNQKQLTALNELAEMLEKNSIPFNLNTEDETPFIDLSEKFMVTVDNHKEETFNLKSWEGNIKMIGLSIDTIKKIGIALNF